MEQNLDFFAAKIFMTYLRTEAPPCISASWSARAFCLSVSGIGGLFIAMIDGGSQLQRPNRRIRVIVGGG